MSEYLLGGIIAGESLFAFSLTCIISIFILSALLFLVRGKYYIEKPQKVVRDALLLTVYVYFICIFFLFIFESRDGGFTSEIIIWIFTGGFLAAWFAFLYLAFGTGIVILLGRILARLIDTKKQFQFILLHFISSSLLFISLSYLYDYLQ